MRVYFGPLGRSPFFLRGGSLLSVGIVGLLVRLAAVGLPVEAVAGLPVARLRAGTVAGLVVVGLLYAGRRINYGRK